MQGIPYVKCKSRMGTWVETFLDGNKWRNIHAASGTLEIGVRDDRPFVKFGAENSSICPAGCALERSTRRLSIISPAMFDDNRMANLQAADRSTNSQNQRLQVRGPFGLFGVQSNEDSSIAHCYIKGEGRSLDRRFPPAREAIQFRDLVSLYQ